MFHKLSKNYNEFHASEIATNRFQPEDFHDALDGYLQDLKVTELGSSVEGRPIRAITVGEGPIKVLMWSQMHGNESTASRAIIDLFKLNSNPGSIAPEWKEILAKVSICIVPILNPDGAAQFIRRNSMDIDLNRDARLFVSPEAKILRDIIKDFNPSFAFNLHDQRRFYNIGDSPKPSTISFLAPAYNVGEEINGSREKAMQVIAYLRSELEKEIPGQIGLYDDTFSPRAFGDYCQSQGVSTILVEGGWEKYDMEKEEVRKWYFCLLIAGLHAIASGRYQDYSIDDYRAIPSNKELLFDILIRNAMLQQKGYLYKADIGIIRSEIALANSTGYYSTSIIEDIGDLAEWHGFEELDASALLVQQGKILDINFSDWENSSDEEKYNYFCQGYLYLLHKTSDSPNHIDGPINLIASKKLVPSSLKTEHLANFFLVDKTGKIKYVVLNGFLWPVGESFPPDVNGLIIS